MWKQNLARRMATRGFWISYTVLSLAGLFGFTLYVLRVLEDSNLALQVIVLQVLAMGMFGASLALLILPKRTILSAPGTRLEKIARCFWPSKIYERVFEQTISDMRLEYEAALHRGEFLHARWI